MAGIDRDGRVCCWFAISIASWEERELGGKGKIAERYRRTARKQWKVAAKFQGAEGELEDGRKPESQRPWLGKERYLGRQVGSKQNRPNQSCGRPVGCLLRLLQQLTIVTTQ
jgi:hypothetical protein